MVNAKNVQFQVHIWETNLGFGKKIEKVSSVARNYSHGTAAGAMSSGISNTQWKRKGKQRVTGAVTMIVYINK